MAARTWTLEQKKRQAEAVRRWTPWEQSTGPKSPEGKAAASKNAYRGGHWLKIRELSCLVNAEVRQARELVEATPRL